MVVYLLLLRAIDGTSMFVPDSPANLTRYGRQTGSHGGSGYPMLRLVAVVACGTETIIDAVFGPYCMGELRYVPRLLSCLRPGMLLSAHNRKGPYPRRHLDAVLIPA